MRITSTGVSVTGELEATSLDINGNGDISGTLTVHNTLTVNKSQGSSALTINNAGNGGWTQYASTNDGVYGYIGSGSHLLSPVINDNDFVLRAQGEFAVSIAAAEKFRIDSSGNATFSGNITAAGTLNSDNITVGKSDGNNSSISLTANTGNWTFTNVQSSRNLEISDSDGTGTVMTIDTSGNVGIGETSPSSKLVVAENINPAITILDTTTIPAGTQNAGNNITFGTLQFQWGAESYSYMPSIEARFNETDASFGRKAGLDFKVGNIASVTAMSILSSGDVGIGTDSPSFPLEVDGGSGDGIKIKAGNSSNDDSFLVANNADSTLFLVDGGGNVGIGTTSPGYNLEVYGTDAKIFAHYSGNSRGGIAAFSGQRIAMTTTSLNDNLVFGYNSVETSASASFVEHMRIDNGTGNVGIGTNFVSAKLQVHSTNAGQPTVPLFIVNESTTVGTEARLGFAANTNDDIASGRYSYISTVNTSGSNGQAMTFATNESGASAVERMRISSSGDVGIGVTPESASRLHIKYQAGDNNCKMTLESNNSGDSFINYSAASNEMSAGFDTSAAKFVIAGGDNLSVPKFALTQSTGTLEVTGDVIAYGSPSDKRLKENIKSIDSALDKVMKLKGVTFDWIQKKDQILNIKEDIGFIAQDVQKVVPELVRENEDGMLSMRHQGIAPILLEAIKELKAEIEELKLNKCNCNK